MSAWLTIGYIAAVLVSVVVAVTVVTCVVDKSKKFFVWLVRVWCCMDDFGRDWDGKAGNGFARVVELGGPQRSDVLPAAERTPARQKMPSIKNSTNNASEDSGGAITREALTDTPDLSVLSTSVATRV